MNNQWSNPPTSAAVPFGGTATPSPADAGAPDAVAPSAPEAVTHIAGLVIEIGPLLRQRCAWCGVTLLDYDLRRVAVPIGQDPRPATWKLGVPVTVDGIASWVEPGAEECALPANACARVPA